MLNLLVKIIFEIKINCARRVRIRFKRRSPKSSKCFNKPPDPEWWETCRSRMRNFKVCLINISLLVCQSLQRESQRRRAGKRDGKGEMEICTDHLADCWTLPMSYVLYFFSSKNLIYLHKMLLYYRSQNKCNVWRGTDFRLCTEKKIFKWENNFQFPPSHHPFPLFLEEQEDKYLISHAAVWLRCDYWNPNALLKFNFCTECRMCGICRGETIMTRAAVCFNFISHFHHPKSVPLCISLHKSRT